jgi:hypothetical protein
MTEEGLLDVGLFDMQSLSLTGSLPKGKYSTYQMRKKNQVLNILNPPP